MARKVLNRKSLREETEAAEAAEAPAAEAAAPEAVPAPEAAKSAPEAREPWSKEIVATFATLPVQDGGRD